MVAHFPHCALCRDTGGDLIWQNTELRVVLVNDPDLPGYTRVIWKSHIAEMTELSVDQRHRVMDAVFTVERVQRHLLAPDKVNLASLGNMTPHMHWHVIPRWRNDPWFPDAIWAPRKTAVEGASDWGQSLPSLRARINEYCTALAAELSIGGPA